MKRRLTSILATDMAGYTRVVERDEAGSLQRLKDIRDQIVSPRIAAASGRVVKLTGNGALFKLSTRSGVPSTCSAPLQIATPPCPTRAAFTSAQA